MAFDFCIVAGYDLAHDKGISAQGLMTMHNPPHPGGILKHDVLPHLGLSLTQAAAQIGVSRVQLSRFVNARAAVTPALAVKLAKWHAAPSARMWLQMQTDYDIWQIEHAPQAEAA